MVKNSYNDTIKTLCNILSKERKCNKEFSQRIYDVSLCLSLVYNRKQRIIENNIWNNLNQMKHYIIKE